jgi:hypothetical protein
VRLPQTSFFGIAFLALVACASPPRVPAQEPYEHDAREMEREDRDVLENADVLTVLRLDPESRVADGFHGFAVVNRAEVPAPSRKAVIDVLSRAISDSDGRMAKCFIPRHGISAKKGDASVDLVICFECSQLYVYGRFPSRIPIGSREGAAMEKLFTDLGAR